MSDWTRAFSAAYQRDSLMFLTDYFRNRGLL